MKRFILFLTAVAAAVAAAIGIRRRMKSCEEPEEQIEPTLTPGPGETAPHEQGT